MKHEGQKSEWEESLGRSQSTLDSVEPALLHEGPSFEVQTKQGQRLNVSTQFYYFEGADFTPSSTLENGLRLYMFAKNEQGQVVETRVASIFQINQKTLECKSKIIVREKGQGLASPIEEAFIQTLQHIADTENKRVIWKVENQNLERLEAYRGQEGADPTRLAELEAEQARWQYLYGEGGKFGISKGKRIFEPTELPIHGLREITHEALEQVQAPEGKIDAALERMLNAAKASLDDSINHSKKGNDARRKLDPQSHLLMHVLEDENPKLVEKIHRAFQNTQERLTKAIQAGQFDAAKDMAWDLQEQVQSMVLAEVDNDRTILEVEALTHWVTAFILAISLEQERLGE